MRSFETTHWSVVRAAKSAPSDHARQALETLCSTYWYPLYGYIRGRGYCPEDARDLIQDFFVRFLEKDYLKGVDPAKGKFRSFLLAALNHFLANEFDRAKAVKRGGRITFLPLDFAAVEDRYAYAAPAGASPERIFDRAWALASLECALARLRDEYEKLGKANLFDRLKGTLTAQEDCLPYREIGAEFSLSEDAVKVAVYRMRRRYRELLLDEIAQTLSEGERVEDELRHLFSAIGDS